MQSATDRPFRVVENTWIPLADGCRLAARLWLPESAERQPVPALLEYLPYRKRDGTAWRDEVNHPWFAAHGYACARVDIRGNGESDGLMLDEYTARELDDGVQVIEWLAAQPWCSGAVGMIGISWGGFNGLQIGALAPAPLKAIVTVCSTDDRYATDIHYMGGCLLNDNMTWSQQMLGYSSRPPDPALLGDAWRERWIERLEAMPLLAAGWLEHPHRDAYWKHGSVCEDPAAVEAPVLAVGGWADAYTSAIPRLLASLRCPRKAIIGPWEHRYPHLALIEPRVDFLSEALRWWDRWLRGADTGVDDDPDLRAYILESAPPDARLRPRAGRWVSVPRWPPERTAWRDLHLGAGTLSAEPSGCPSAVTIRTPQHLGAACGAFCPGMRTDEELASDQTGDDALSVCFDSEPLTERLEILGAPLVELELESDRASALLAARLCDVRADGTAARITWAPLDLTHHGGHAEPVPLRTGQRYRVSIELEHVGYAVPAGHRLRLALSTTYWPMLWPSPEAATVTVHMDRARLRIPLLDGDEAPPPPPAPSIVAPAREHVRAASWRAVTGRIEDDGSVVTETEDDLGADRHPVTRLESSSRVRQRFAISPDDPLSATAVAEWTHEIARDDWRVRTESSTRMTADRRHFHLEARLQAFENDVAVFERRWRERIQRR